MKQTDNNLTCVLEKFENSHAVLSIQINNRNVQNLNIPKRYLPINCKEKDIIHIQFLSEKMSKMENKKVAQHILDEILDN